MAKSRMVKRILPSLHVSPCTMPSSTIFLRRSGWITLLRISSTCSFSTAIAFSSSGLTSGICKFPLLLAETSQSAICSPSRKGYSRKGRKNLDKNINRYSLKSPFISAMPYRKAVQTNTMRPIAQRQAQAQFTAFLPPDPHWPPLHVVCHPRISPPNEGNQHG